VAFFVEFCVTSSKSFIVQRLYREASVLDTIFCRTKAKNHSNSHTLEKQDKNMKPLLSSLSIWSGAITLIIVLAGAIAFTFTDIMSDKLFGNKRIGFTIMLYAYAVYRGFRIYQLLKQKRNEEE